MIRASPQQLLGVVPRSGPIYLQIYHRIRTLILSGTWPAGTQLPSSRSLASDLGVSRNTAILALEKLVADGWVISRAGAGMFVSPEAPPARGHHPSSDQLSSPASFAPVPFEMVGAATDVFPVESWSKILRDIWSRNPAEALHEGAVSGWPQLQSAIASYLHAVRGLACSSEQVFIVSSTQSAVDLCIRALATSGDSIWVEDPGYPYLRATFEIHRLAQVPVSIDGEGIVVSQGIERARSAKLVYVTPTCQFPRCVTMSRERRDKLINWAEDQHSYIIEDDWDFNSIFDKSHAPEPLAANDSERVILIHSFNKLLFPGLRMAAVVVPLKLVSSFADSLYAIERFPNIPNQIALAEFLNRGMMSTHLRRLRQIHQQRRAAMHDGVRAYLSRWGYCHDGQPGLHSLIWIRNESDSDLASAARASGIDCGALNDFVVGPAEVQGALLLGFASFPPDVIDTSLQQLARTIARLC